MQEIDKEFEDARRYALDVLWMATEIITKLNEVANQLNNIDIEKMN